MTSSVAGTDNCFANSYNLSALIGVRFWLCLGVVFYHTVQALSNFFIRDSSCRASFFHFPLLGTYFVQGLESGLVTFWIISGFLCEYSLHNRLIRKSNCSTINESNVDDDKEQKPLSDLDCRDYFLHLSNRLLRIYPLYFVHFIWATCLKFIIDAYSRTHAVNFVAEPFDIFYWIRSALMLVKLSSPFVAVAWYILVDCHGYLATTILFGLSYRQVYKAPFGQSILKKYLLVTLYMFGVYNTIMKKPFPFQQGVSETTVESLNEYGCWGFDTLKETDLERLGVSNDSGSYNAVYPNFNFTTSKQIEARTVCNPQFDAFFTSINMHGSAYMLGVLLYLNLHDRYRSKQTFPKRWFFCTSIAPLLKLFGYLIFFQVTRNWKKGFYSISGIPVYFLLDAILSMNPNISFEQKTAQKFFSSSQETFIYVTSYVYNRVINFLTHPVFLWLAPYTYGIYLIHIYIVYALIFNNTKGKFDIIRSTLNSSDACEVMDHAGYGFTLLNIMKLTAISFVLSLIPAMILHKYVQQPINRWRTNK